MAPDKKEGTNEGSGVSKKKNGEINKIYGQRDRDTSEMWE